MRDISSVCCLNTFAITTKTARILDSGREHRTVEVTLWPLLRSFLMNDWVGCITATIGLPEPSSLFSEAVRSNSLKSTVWTHSWAAATEDLSDRGGFLVQFACHIQIIATGNQAIFDADEILAKDRVIKGWAVRRGPVQATIPTSCWLT